MTQLISFHSFIMQNGCHYTSNNLIFGKFELYMGPNDAQCNFIDKKLSTTNKVTFSQSILNLPSTKHWNRIFNYQAYTRRSSRKFYMQSAFRI